MTTTSGATTFCHIVEKGLYERIPDAGTPLYLKFDLLAGQRVGGQPVGTMYTSQSADASRTFGGIVTYDQPDQSTTDVIAHPTENRSFCLLRTTIHGPVQAVVDDPSAIDPHTLVVQQFAKTPIPEPYVDPLETLRKVPNGTLFVMLCI
jgi:hypothetical protein